jgi:DNA-binding SARP family transcriptional activator
VPVPAVLRPLPADGSFTTGARPVPGSELAVVDVPPGGYVAESVAASLAAEGRWADAVWLRSDARDAWETERELVRACRRRWFGSGEPGPPSMRGVLADAPPGAAVVWEVGGRLGVGARRLLSAMRRPGGAGVLVVTERRMLRPARRTPPPAIPAWLDPALRDRLLALAGWRTAVVHDVAGAARAWDVPAVQDAIFQATSWQDLLRRITGRLLAQCDDDQLAALRTALRTGYWDGPAPVALRPWTVPLEERWHWLRPLWAPALAEGLAAIDSAPAPARPSAPRPVTRPVMEVALFGALDVRVDGRPVPYWFGRRGPGVLRYLLSRPGRRCTRDELLATFWPDVDPDLARNRLQVAVSGLRKAFLAVTSVNVIEFAEGGYRVNPDLAVEGDVDRFEASMAIARRASTEEAEYAALADAVACYRGDFAADAPDEIWSLLPRETLRLAYIDALDRMSAIDLVHDRLDRCIMTAQRMLQLDPCREDAHRLLMRCFLRQGQSYRAERQYAFCCQVLRATLDVEPSEATRELWRTIRVGSQR